MNLLTDFQLVNVYLASKLNKYVEPRKKTI